MNQPVHCRCGYEIGMVVSRCPECGQAPSTTSAPSTAGVRLSCIAAIGSHFGACVTMLWICVALGSTRSVIVAMAVMLVVWLPALGGLAKLSVWWIRSGQENGPARASVLTTVWAIYALAAPAVLYGVAVILA